MTEFKIGDDINIPYDTLVDVQIDDKIKFVGVIVGKATNDITQGHIVRCIDGKFPNEVYKYDTIVVPLHLLKIK